MSKTSFFGFTPGLPLAPGFHVLEVASPVLGASLLAPEHGAGRTMYVRTSALVTNLAVHFKLGRENALAWVTTLDRGQPVAGAAVQVSDCNGKLLAINQVELSLACEAAGHEFTIFPRPSPHLATEDVFVMTFVDGVPYDQALDTYPDVIDGERLLNLAITGTLEHMVAYGIFHGDMHAGNVLINAQGDFSLIDFGIAGRIDAEQRAAVVKFLFGFGRNDNLLQLQGLQAFGAIPEGEDLPALAAQLLSLIHISEPTRPY